MSTTTIRLSPELKLRVAAAAKRAGTTAHGFILEAIAEKADQDERRQDFQEEAERRFARVMETGKTIPWDEMRRYVEARAAGKEAPKPRARRMGR